MSKFDAKTLLQIFGMFAVLVALMPIYCKDSASRIQRKFIFFVKAQPIFCKDIYKKVIMEKMRDKTFFVCSFRGKVVKMVLMACAWWQ